MKKITRLLFAAAMAFLMLTAMPASAVILEEYYSGQISKLDASKKTLTMQVSSVYEGEQWVVFAKSGLKNNIVSGTISNPDIFKDLKQGDPIEAAILGGPGGKWIAVGKVGTTGSTEKPLIASYGDPSKLLSYFYQGYTLTAKTAPDCSSCEGTVCTASNAMVSVFKNDELVETDEMFPGDSHVFGWNTEYQYILKIKFNSGEASSDSCPGTGPMSGPQAVSDFTIYDTQRSAITAAEVDIPAAPTMSSTQSPDETETSEPSSPATPDATKSPVPQPTQSGFGFEIILAAGIIGFLMFAAGRK